MKNLIFVLFFALTFSVSAQEDQIITAANIIQDLVESGDLNANPLVVLNNKVLDSNAELNSITQEQIATISVIQKRNPEMVELYGAQAKNGVVQIKTQQKFKSLFTNVVWIINNIVSTQEELKSLDPDSILSVKVFMADSETDNIPAFVKTYFTYGVTGVVYVTLKE